LSTPAAFVLAGSLLVLALARGAQRAPTKSIVLAGGAWAMSFTLSYLWIYGPAATNPYMQQFWRDSLLMVGRPGFVARLWQGTREVVWQTFVGGSTEPGITPLFDVAVNLGTGPLLFLLAVGLSRLGTWAGRRKSALVWAPIAVAVAASLVGKYPVAARTMLFAVPALILVGAAGGFAVIRSMPVAWRPAAAVVTGLCLLGPPAPLDVNLARHAVAFENVRDAAREYRTRRDPGDPVYIFAAALPAWTFYTTEWSHPDTARVARMARLGSFGGPAFENAPPRSRPIGLEGDSLIYPLWGGHEIIGLSHGAQGRSAMGVSATAPDTNWTTNEARRIRNAAHPRVWVLTIRTLGLERYLWAATDLCLDHLRETDGYALVLLSRRASASLCR
jgi:hypothetical protein